MSADEQDAGNAARQANGQPPLKQFANLDLDGDSPAKSGTRPVASAVPPLPRRSPWRQFDAQARAEFCEQIRNGVQSRSGATRLLRLCPTTVNAWIARGKVEDWPDEDYEYRAFYVQLRAAEAAREALVDLTLGRAAQGFQATVDEDGSETVVRVLPDWRAAAELGKRQERMKILGTTVEREQVALERDRLALERERFDARLSEIKVLLAEGGLKRRNGRLYWPPELAALMTPQERERFAAFMERAGLIEAKGDEVEHESMARDTQEDERNLRLAERWGLALKESRAVDAETLTDEGGEGE